MSDDNFYSNRVAVITGGGRGFGKAFGTALAAAGAHAVLIDEVTTAYERLHVTASLSVLHGAADQFRFVVPAGFEVTGVTAPQVARWAVAR